MILIQAITSTLAIIINLYIWIVIIAALITWVNPDPYNPIVQFLQRLTEPVYKKMRQFFPTVIGGVDLAPLILIIILQFILQILVRI